MRNIFIFTFKIYKINMYVYTYTHTHTYTRFGFFGGEEPYHMFNIYQNSTADNQSIIR